MARISLSRRERRKKTVALIAYWLQVVSLVSLFYNVVCTLIVDEVLNETTIPTPSIVGKECSSLCGKRKRAKSHGALLEGITKAASLLSQGLAASSTKLSAAIESHIDIQRKTSKVIPELKKMTSLSTRDMYRAMKKITSVPANVLGFFSFNEDQREDWVKYLLEDDA